ncbi:MAG TPA: hypothetical protein VFW30_10665 [Bryocella sp.]|nr:hypothetical protein [Bryocella sp.]
MRLILSLLYFRGGALFRSVRAVWYTSKAVSIEGRAGLYAISPKELVLCS